MRYDNIINYYKAIKVSEVNKGIVFKRLKCHQKTKMSVKKCTLNWNNTFKSKISKT